MEKDRLTAVLHNEKIYDENKKKCLFKVDFEYANLGKFGDLERLLGLKMNQEKQKLLPTSVVLCVLVARAYRPLQHPSGIL